MRIGEGAARPEHGGERVGVGVDRRVGVIGAPAGDLDLLVGDLDPEAILAEAQFVDSAESVRGARVEP